MKIVVQNGKAILTHSHTKNLKSINAYLKELKDILGVDWPGMCPLYGLASSDHGAAVLRSWRTGKKEMPDEHWVTTLHALGKVERCSITKE
ncbi:hypothetical protein [Vibrio owensii]|uniref:hypothetical protein n=1 Tax=Vibrio owensii TaxID=696485 RepID=UPI0018F21868|nr:hypothetical protein [Vibrio owensii]